MAGWKKSFLSSGAKIILIKHVLSSIPIHTMAAYDIPKCTIDRIDSILSNFLWGDKDGHKKHHWISWDKICHPFKEGGLGIRKLEDVMRALRMKMAWSYALNNTLWANFMNNKYGPLHNHNNNKKGPAFWMNIQKIWIFMQPNISWEVGYGRLNFWKDAWLPGGALGDHPASHIFSNQHPYVLLSVHDFLNPSRDVHFLNISDSFYDILKCADITLSQRPDKPIWNPNDDGSFTVKSA